MGVCSSEDQGSQHEIDGRLLSARKKLQISERWQVVRTAHTTKKGLQRIQAALQLDRKLILVFHIHEGGQTQGFRVDYKLEIRVLLSRDLGGYKCLCLFPVSYVWGGIYNLKASHGTCHYLGSRHEALGTHSESGNPDRSTSAARSHRDSWQCIHVGWVLHINQCL